jgi:hypothetical protein
MNRKERRAMQRFSIPSMDEFNTMPEAEKLATITAMHKLLKEELPTMLKEYEEELKASESTTHGKALQSDQS